MAEQVGADGFPPVHQSLDKLLAHAATTTGLDDFGGDSFLVGLENLVEGLHTEACLTFVGKYVAYFNILEYLKNRIEIVAYRRANSWISDKPIVAPLIILGLPRTGTTILFELLAQDTNNRYPSSWEVSKPVPPPVPDSPLSDSRIRLVDLHLKLSEILSPGFRRIHAIGARLPQECVYILASHFISEQFGFMYHIPTYRQWAMNQDMSPGYEWHHFFLQHLQSNFESPRWLLKTPTHIAYITSLLRQYPDANIVWTHREPIDALTSFSSLIYTLRKGFSNRVDAFSTGDFEVRHFAKMIQRGMHQRGKENQSQFFDVSFRNICAQPIEVIKKIYENFELQLTDDAEIRMREYLQRRPRNLYGKHSYRAEQFGIDDDAYTRLFDDYTLRFGEFF